MKKKPTGEEIIEDLLKKIRDKRHAHHGSYAKSLRIHPPMDKHCRNLVMKTALDVQHFSEFKHQKVKSILSSTKFEKITHVFFAGETKRPMACLYNGRALVISGDIKDLRKTKQSE